MNEAIGCYLLHSIVAVARLLAAACIEEILSFILANKKIKDFDSQGEVIKISRIKLFLKSPLNGLPLPIKIFTISYEEVEDFRSF